MLSIFDEVYRNGEPDDAGVIIGRRVGYLEQFEVLWYDGVYTSWHYSDDLVPTGRNFKDEFKKKEAKHHG